MYPEIRQENIEERQKRRVEICPYYSKAESQCELVKGLVETIIRGAGAVQGSGLANRSADAQKTLKQTTQTFCAYDSYRQCQTFLEREQ